MAKNSHNEVVRFGSYSGVSRNGRTDKLKHGMCQSNREYTPDELEFMQAMDRYKRENQRPFPTWHEVLRVLLSLGYRKSPEALTGL